MKIRKIELILNDHMELIPDLTKKSSIKRKKKAMPKVTRMIGTAHYKEVSTDSFLVESYHFKKSGVKVTRIYKKNVFTTADEGRPVNKFLNQKIEVVQ